MTTLLATSAKKTDSSSGNVSHITSVFSFVRLGRFSGSGNCPCDLSNFACTGSLHPVSGRSIGSVT